MLLRNEQETRRKAPKINYNKLLKWYFENWLQIIKVKLFLEMEKKCMHKIPKQATERKFEGERNFTLHKITHFLLLLHFTYEYIKLI